ncbi:MAG: peptide chain release factor 1 [bacterium]|nr:peptide chain release factor 1 [bacterium]
MNDLQRLELQKIISELEKYEGRGTQLISLYIKAGSNLASVVDMLEREKNPASNIKDKNTRKNVLAALDRLIQFLKKLGKTPETGIAVFCGNVSPVPGETDMRLFYVVPPEPLNFSLYHCDERFYVEPLKEMLKPKDTYGVIMMDNEEALIGFLKGTRFEVVHELENYYHGKHHKGGQSARRFQRLIELQSHEFKKKVAEAAKQTFYGAENLKGIIIAGPGPTKEDFYREDYLPGDLKQKVIAVVDISYIDPVVGIKEILEKVGDKLPELDAVKEKRIYREFFEHVVKTTGLAAYGFEEVKQALENNAVAKLLISEKLLEEQGDKLQELLELAKQTGAEVHVLSTETEEGKQFYQLFGGLGAVLRYALEPY